MSYRPYLCPISPEITLYDTEQPNPASAASAYRQAWETASSLPPGLNWEQLCDRLHIGRESLYVLDPAWRQGYPILESMTPWHRKAWIVACLLPPGLTTDQLLEWTKANCQPEIWNYSGFAERKALAYAERLRIQGLQERGIPLVYEYDNPDPVAGRRRAARQHAAHMALALAS